MKKILILLSVLLPITSRAQSYLQFGPAVNPMSAWGAEIIGDFKVVNLTSDLSLGLGAMAFASTSKTHELPEEGKRVNAFYAAPQLSMRYAFSDKFNCYLRGGAGWLGDRKEGSDLISHFMCNAVAGAGLFFGERVGIYAEAGLPFSSIGLQFKL